ncbi:MAG: porphobilinogen synthase [Longimicrobiales bacterium]
MTGRRPMTHDLRCLRRTPALRALVRETRLDPGSLVWPVFVTEVEDEPVEVPSMPGVYRWPVAALDEVARRATEARVGGVLIFGIPAEKDDRGTQASTADGIAQRGIRALHAAGYAGVVIADTCLCEYTDHGHCGLLDDGGALRHADTCARLAEIAVSLAEAGADLVAPSAAVDGMVAAIRGGLDGAGLGETGILAYSAKYASSYYGPFRDAAGGTPRFGDRRSHQMDPANVREALREHAEDVAQGADILMVKPGLAYMDVLRATRDAFPAMPLAVYNVSGEYSMVKAAAANGWIDERSVVLETLTGFRRAGADVVITYHALEAARWSAP